VAFQRSRILSYGLTTAVAVLALASAVLTPSAAAATNAGQLYSFGDNQSGQLGTVPDNGTTSANPSPGLVAVPGTNAPVTEVAVGGSHTLALTSAGALYSFGGNAEGQLGSMTNLGTSSPNTTPEPVSLPSATGAVVQAAAGSDFSLAVTSTGQLYSFGDNFYGELGNGNNNGNASANWMPTLVTLPGATGPPVRVSAGQYHSLVLTSSGQVFAFGLNSHGELGNTNGNNTQNANPTPALVTLPGATGPPAQVAAGTGFSLVLTSTGQLYTFGENSNGQLGNSDHIGTSTANPSPSLIALPGATGAPVQIAAGTDHSLVVTSSGQVYAFGDDTFGECGPSANGSSTNPTPTLVPLPAGSGPAIGVAAGDGYSLVLTALGQVYAFGNNRFGELGVGTNAGTATANANPEQVTLPGGATFDTIAAGGQAQHALVTIADLAVGSAALPGGTVGAPYAGSPQTSGGTPPYRWSATGLPPGLSIDPTTGSLSGVPSAAGAYQPVFTIVDGDGIIASGPVALAILPAVVSPPRIVSSGVSVSGAAAMFSIRCIGAPGQSCAEHVVGTATERRQGHKVLAVIASKRTGTKPPRPKTARVTVARGSFTLAGGQSRQIRIALNGTGKALLQSFYQVPVSVSFSGTTSVTQAVKFAYRRLAAGTTYTWYFNNVATRVGQLSAVRLPAHAHVVVTCSGAGCTFASRAVAVHGKRTVALTPVFANAQLPQGSAIEIVITAPNSVGVVIRYTMNHDQPPTQTKLCEPPGVPRPTRCA
jgi:alpha-tubulin suppressor-like RCC1 family protein